MLNQQPKKAGRPSRINVPETSQWRVKCSTVRCHNFARNGCKTCYVCDHYEKYGKPE